MNSHESWWFCWLSIPQWWIKFLRFDFKIWDTHTHILTFDFCWRFSGRHGRHAQRSESEDLRRWWPHSYSRAGQHHQRVEGNTSWKQTVWRSHWAQNPQSTGPGRRIVRRWWSDAGVCGAVACRIWSDSDLLQKRSWSGNKRGNPCRGPPPT